MQILLNNEDEFDFAVSFWKAGKQIGKLLSTRKI